MEMLLKIICFFFSDTSPRLKEISTQKDVFRTRLLATSEKIVALRKRALPPPSPCILEQLDQNNVLLFMEIDLIPDSDKPVFYGTFEYLDSLPNRIDVQEKMVACFLTCPAPAQPRPKNDSAAATATPPPSGGGPVGGGGAGSGGDDDSGMNLGKNSKGGDITASRQAPTKGQPPQTPQIPTAEISNCASSGKPPLLMDNLKFTVGEFLVSGKCGDCSFEAFLSWAGEKYNVSGCNTPSFKEGFSNAYDEITMP
jgi:hypothetical protein